MKRVVTVGIIFFISFNGCNQQDIEEAKRLNKNNSMIFHKIKKESTKVTQKEKLAQIDNEAKFKLQKLQNEKIEKLEKIKAQNEQKLKELEVKKVQIEQKEKSRQKEIEANSSIELAKINSKTVLEVENKKIAFYKMATIVLFFLFFIGLIIYYLRYLSKKRHEAYLKEQELKYKAYMEESRLKHENISKMLDIVASDKTDAAIKKEMTKILTYNRSKIIEHKKK